MEGSQTKKVADNLININPKTLEEIYFQFIKARISNDPVISKALNNDKFKINTWSGFQAKQIVWASNITKDFDLFFQELSKYLIYRDDLFDTESCKRMFDGFNKKGSLGKISKDHQKSINSDYNIYNPNKLQKESLKKFKRSFSYYMEDEYDSSIDIVEKVIGQQPKDRRICVIELGTGAVCERINAIYRAAAKSQFMQKVLYIAIEPSFTASLITNYILNESKDYLSGICLTIPFNERSCKGLSNLFKKISANNYYFLLTHSSTTDPYISSNILLDTFKPILRKFLAFSSRELDAPLLLTHKDRVDLMKYNKSNGILISPMDRLDSRGNLIYTEGYKGYINQNSKREANAYKFHRLISSGEKDFQHFSNIPIQNFNKHLSYYSAVIKTEFIPKLIESIEIKNGVNLNNVTQ